MHWEREKKHSSLSPLVTQTFNLNTEFFGKVIKNTQGSKFFQDFDSEILQKKSTLTHGIQDKT